MTYIERIVELDGTITENELNAKQIKEIETGKKDIEKNQAAAEAKAIAKAAILERIGLTADELKTILG
jgi:hypothetical protein